MITYRPATRYSGLQDWITKLYSELVSLDVFRNIADDVHLAVVLSMKTEIQINMKNTGALVWFLTV